MKQVLLILCAVLASATVQASGNSRDNCAKKASKAIFSASFANHDRFLEDSRAVIQERSGSSGAADTSPLRVRR